MNIIEMREIIWKSLPKPDGTFPTIVNPSEIFKMVGASWLYQGSQGEPHALLASGLHSDGYFNVNAATQFSLLCEALARTLAIKLRDLDVIEGNVDAVVSSSFAAITLGLEVAKHLAGAMFVFTEKVGDEQVWSGRFELPAGSRMLQAEELVTTLGTAEKVRRAVLTANPDVEFLQENGKTVLATVVHRPPKIAEYPHYEVYPLMEIEVHSWKPEECPLCKTGSEALKPKPNWQKFQSYMNRK